jgi:hypothetical protein
MKDTEVIVKVNGAEASESKPQRGSDKGVGCLHCYLIRTLTK